ncbi:hypothetical protein GWK47_042044 [Chionoecetes opilio]|uniref:Uncharacterized protein n=1 Tax=Chionoecetes opilio TaxID=41210 RepID=A0A8J4YNF0_CHIOP|nr:hypothetical protein GWK47_042044 [Chionoecetes opilio]
MAKGTSWFLPTVGWRTVRPVHFSLDGGVGEFRLEIWGGGCRRRGLISGRSTRLTQADATAHRRRSAAGSGSTTGAEARRHHLPGPPAAGRTYSLWRWRNTTYLGGPP